MTASIEAEIEALIGREQLPPSYKAIARRYWSPLADLIETRRRAAGRMLVVGINGAQGSGKSTLCEFLAMFLKIRYRRVAAVLAIDDLYLPRKQRAKLAQEIHPLFETRGVPGTHDIGLGIDLLRMLGGGVATHIPCFSKAEDDRLPEGKWTPISPPVDIVLLEGWCVGAVAEQPEDLSTPVNALEADEDAQCIWRGYVNLMLAGPYRDFFAHIDLMIALRPADFESVSANRRLQEQKLRLSGGGSRTMSDAEIERFVQHYERITRNCWRTLCPPAEIRIDVARDRSVSIESGHASLVRETRDYV